MKNKSHFDVSIVIVCMNNLNNLYPCLNSIKKYTMVSYETLVVAYLFSEENLQKLKTDYPWITIIESNEIRGFSENNNLALRQAKGEYCFIVNDDTIMKMPVVDSLVQSFNENPQASFISPNILNMDGTVQFCGRPKLNLITYFLFSLKIFGEGTIRSKYINQKGVFRTYNIMGAAVMVKTNVLKELGFFDENYFFCPEDIALSTLANRSGYHCYVNENISIYHIQGNTSSNIEVATAPAMKKGHVLFNGENNWVKVIIVSCIIITEAIIKCAYFFLDLNNKKREQKVNKYRNIIYAVFSNKSPKEIFIKHYNSIAR